MTDQEKAARLSASTDMVPVQGTVDVDIPIESMWEFFSHADFWPRWNSCFFWARNKDLVKGQHLIWTFQPIKPWLPYKMWAIANIVELVPREKVTWEVTALPGMYARHTYHMENLGDGRTRFGSWEQGMGWGFRPMRWFWLKHFTFVKDESLTGAQRLEDLYRKTGKLDVGDLPKKSYVTFWVVMIALLAMLLVGVAGGIFYFKYVHVTAIPIAPGVHAFFGGGGNSLLVENGGQSLLIDTKFPPGSSELYRWIEKHGESPVALVLNTHYHYDHTQGNSLYRNAVKVAHANVPALMSRNDNDWWSAHSDGIPSELVSSTRTLRVGIIEVDVVHPPLAAHTSGDLWVYLPQQNIIATGDLVFNRYYPFLDQPEGGTSIPGMIEAVRMLAREHPDAVFLPGHGPLARASDLFRYGDYLQAMQLAAVAARTANLTADEAASKNDLARWGLSVLPSFHHGRLIWSTASHNARWAYTLAGEPPSSAE